MPKPIPTTVVSLSNTNVSLFCFNFTGTRSSATRRLATTTNIPSPSYHPVAVASSSRLNNSGCSLPSLDPPHLALVPTINSKTHPLCTFSGKPGRQLKARKRRRRLLVRGEKRAGSRAQPKRHFASSRWVWMRWSVGKGETRKVCRPTPKLIPWHNSSITR